MIVLLDYYLLAIACLSWLRRRLIHAFFCALQQSYLLSFPPRNLSER